jgi:hypothetical protein
MFGEGVVEFALDRSTVRCRRVILVGDDLHTMQDAAAAMRCGNAPLPARVM